jgi:azurin
MTFRITLLAGACALALAGCGDRTAPSDDQATPPAATEPAPAASVPPAASASLPSAATTALPADTTLPATAPAPGSEKPAAVVANCATQIDGTDAMQYDVGSITVPASCTKFTITLKHSGTMPVAAMGHNVVISKQSDMAGVTADGIGAGVAANYVKPGDARVIAHTPLVGGGQTTSVTFDVSKIKDGGPYEFYCSFPGHATVMKGPISVG